MPEARKAGPGMFCWVELSTSDLAAAKTFYSAVFGWTFTEATMANGSTYTMANLGDKLVAGALPLQEPARKVGTPPHWLSYVAVADIDASSERAGALGATVQLSPLNLGPGIMAVLQDPTGAVFALWQAIQPLGTFLFGDPGALAWNELSTSDVDRAGKFYTGLFGWRPEAMQMGDLVYTTFNNGPAQVGGMMAQAKELAGTPSLWSVYFAVADADAAVAKASTLGAKALTPVHDIPGIGRFAFLADPQGAAFAVIKFTPPVH